MRNFIAITLLLLIGMITTAAASPPGLNSKSNVYAQVMPDKAELQAIVAINYTYTTVPSADARAGCIIGVVDYTIGNEYSLQAELQPIFLFEYTKLTQVADDNRNSKPLCNANQDNTEQTNRPVCASARDAVTTETSFSSTNKACLHFY